MKTLVICTAMSAMILCACGGKNTQSTEETAKVVPMAVITPAINQLTDQPRVGRSFLMVRQRKAGVERTKTLSRITDGW